MGLTLHQKLASIRSMCDVVQKGKRGYNYTYTDITEILAKVTAGMKKYGVMLIPSMVPDTSSVTQNVIRKTKVDKTGTPYEQVDTEMLFCTQMLFTWVDTDNPEDKIEVPWYATGSMSDCSQALGGSCTYTMRQFLTSFFQIAQSDNDVDAYRSKQKEAEVAEEVEVATEIIKKLDKEVKDYLETNSDKQEEVGKELRKFFTKYVKDANYNKVKESKLAGKMLSDFENTFLKG